MSAIDIEQLRTYDPPRRVYIQPTLDWRWTETLWRQYFLSANESGEDEAGNWQVFSLTQKARTLLPIPALPDAPKSK